MVLFKLCQCKPTVIVKGARIMGCSWREEATDSPESNKNIYFLAGELEQKGKVSFNKIP